MLSRKLGMFMAAAAILLLAAGAFAFSALNPQQVQFKAEQDLLKVGNGYYEIAFSATNGAVVYIEDKATRKKTSTGNSGGNLWMAFFADDQMIASNAVSNFPTSGTTPQAGWCCITAGRQTWM